MKPLNIISKQRIHSDFQFPGIPIQYQDLRNLEYPYLYNYLRKKHRHEDIANVQLFVGLEKFQKTKTTKLIH